MVRLLVALATLSFTASAIAQPGLASPSDDDEVVPRVDITPSAEAGPPESISYRRSIVQADSIAGAGFIVASVAFVPCLAGIFSEHSDGNNPACLLFIGSAMAGLGTFVLAAPIVHLHEGNPSAAAISLALRLGLPALGYLAAESIENANGDAGSVPGLLMVGSIAAAITIDWVVLAKKKARLSPIAARTEGGLRFGVAGSF